MRDIERVLGPRLYFERVEARARVLSIAIRRRSAAEAERLRESPDAQAQRLALVLERVARDDLDTAVLPLMSRIEVVRRDTLRSTEVVQLGKDRTERLAWVCARASQPPSGVRLLHHALAVWRPKEVLELGTCVGISGAHQAAALAVTGGGRLTSLEAHAALAARARENWRRAGIENAEVVVGRFRDTLAPVLSRARWEFAFIDGNHVGKATRAYVDCIARASAPGALLAVDDIDYDKGMRKAWEASRNRPDVAASAEVGKIGLLALR